MIHQRSKKPNRLFDLSCSVEFSATIVALCVSNFQATVLLDDVNQTREPILMTHHGLPSAYLIDSESYKAMEQRMKILEGIAQG